MEPEKRKTRAAALSVAVNVLLVGLKVAVGLATGSVAVLSEAIHSSVDLAASLIAWFSVLTSSKPADQDHPFGHGKIENMSGTVEAILIVGAAVWIVVEAADKLLHPSPSAASMGWGVAVMGVSAIATFLVARHLMAVGKETGSVALVADAWHLQTDCVTSAGVMAALGVVETGRFLLPALDLTWLDPVAAILVALLIMRAAWGLTVQAAADLFDVSLPAEEVEAARRAALGVGGVRAVPRVSTRKAGPDRFIELVIAVEGIMPVAEAHRLSDEVEDAVGRLWLRTRVTVHVEPHGPVP